MELARGIEPPTCGLQNRCSAIELRQPDMTCPVSTGHISSPRTLTTHQIFCQGIGRETYGLAIQPLRLRRACIDATGSLFYTPYFYPYFGINT